VQAANKQQAGTGQRPVVARHQFSLLHSTQDLEAEASY
jgi:hypothetical protein